MEVLISLVTIVVSMATSSLAAALVTFRLNESKDKRFFLRQKLEDIYVTTNRFSNHLIGHYLKFMPVMLGEYDFNTALDMVIESGKDARKNDFEKIEMNLRIYFPELLDDFLKLLKIRDVGNTVLNSFKIDYKKGCCYSKKHYSEMKTIIENISYNETIFYGKLTESARDLMEHPCQFKLNDFVKFICKK